MFLSDDRRSLWPFGQGLIVNIFYSIPITIAKLALSAGRSRSQFVNSKLDTSLGVLAVTMAWFGTKYAAQILSYNPSGGLGVNTICIVVFFGPSASRPERQSYRRSRPAHLQRLSSRQQSAGKRAAPQLRRVRDPFDNLRYRNPA